MQSGVVVVGICLPFPPSFTIWFPTMMMKYGHISRTDNIGCQQADSAQGLTHCPYLY